MQYLGREGHLLMFDEVPENVVPGGYLRQGTTICKIVYVDHENGELGCLPVSRKEAAKVMRSYRDESGAGDA